jgi:hypothetical protein
MSLQNLILLGWRMFADRGDAAPTAVIVGVVRRRLQGLNTSFPEYVVIATLSNPNRPVATRV